MRTGTYVHTYAHTTYRDDACSDQLSVKLCEPDGSFFLVQCWNRVSISLQDEVTAPLSVAFHPHGSKMYCGFHNCIRIFDVTRAGRQAETRSTFGELWV